MSLKPVERDAIEDIFGPRTPYVHHWPTRVDQNCIEEPEKWVQSACVLCSNGCGLDIGVKQGKIVGVRGRDCDRVNHGRLGPKGLNGWVANAHKDRLKYPLIRKDGELQRASWDEAMSLITERAKDVRKRLTAHGIGFYTSGQLFLEEYYALAMIGKAGLNTLHMDGNTRLCTATAAASMRESFGSDGQPGSYTDIDVTDCIFMVGHNMAATQTVLFSRVLDRLAGPNPPALIVIDPRRSATAEHATIDLAPKIGTNMAVLNGIQHLLFKNDWINHEFVSKRVIFLRSLQEKVETYTPDVVERISGVPREDLIAAAKVIGTTKTLLSTALQGVYQSNQATASACQVNNINLLRGLIGKPGCGIFQMNGQPTAQNNREAGCDGEFPAFRNFSNPNHMQELADLWNIDYNKVPHWNQPTHIENMLKYIDSGSIQMFWISGTNPLVSLPNLPRVRKLLTKPDLFVVCQDIFLTETANIADVVLPAAMWGEKTGCFTNVDRTVHLSHQAIDPPGESRSDLEIFLDFGRRMDFRDKDGAILMPWSTPEEVFEAWKRVSKGRPCDYSGLTYAKLTGGSGIQWPCTEDAPLGTERLFSDGVFYTDIEYCESYGHDLETGAPYTKSEYRRFHPAGRAILKAADYIPSLEEPDDDYPLQLSTGRNVYHFHTRTKTGRSKKLQDAAPEPQLTISEKDAERLGIKADDMVLVESRRGKIEIAATIGPIAEGQTFVPFHYGYWDDASGRARAANELTEEQWDPISKQPMFKSGAVRVTRLGSASSSSSSVKKPTPISAREQQSALLEQVRHNKPDAHRIHRHGDKDRKRFVDDWLDSTLESIDVLLDLTAHLIPTLTHDHEILYGMKIMRRIAGRVRDRMAPFDQRAQRDPGNRTGGGRAVTTGGDQDDTVGDGHDQPASSASHSTTVGNEVAHELRRALFQHAADRRRTQGTDPAYEALYVCQGLHTFVMHVAGMVDALGPTAQALWDADGFVEAVGHVKTDLGRMQAWAKQQVGVRAPQTLIVPSYYTRDDEEGGHGSE